MTDPDFKFPQVWRTNVAVDQRLPWDLVGTAEFIYSRDVNGISYINANLPAAQTSLRRGRHRAPAGRATSINANVADNIVLGNQNEGYSWHASAHAPEAVPAGLPEGRLQLRRVEEHRRPRVHRVRLVDRRTRSRVTRTTPPSRTRPYFPGNRVFLAGSYRFEYLKFGATTVSFFWQGYTNGTNSYTYAGDLNNDLGTEQRPASTSPATPPR